MRKNLHQYYQKIDQKWLEQFGFRINETTFSKIVEYLHRPKDASSLAVTRILFGLAMLFDIPDERGGASMQKRWGGTTCHFPLLPFLVALPMPYMAVVYAALWLGAAGIMLGYKFRITSVMFTVCYWYLFLIEKSYWNNHSYLFGLVGFLMSWTQANCLWAIDTYLDPSKKKETVPYWNYFLLKYQFFILYFMAGMKKGTAEWLSGYSVQKLSEHWVFDPFKFFLTVPQIDFLIVHCFIFVFDLTVAMWMMWGRTRHVAMLFCAMFHLMNSRLFTIGMFPWVCLATMPLYYPFDWPKVVGRALKGCFLKLIKSFGFTRDCKTKEKNSGDGDDYNKESGNFYLSDDKVKNASDIDDENECDDYLDNEATGAMEPKFDNLTKSKGTENGNNLNNDTTSVTDGKSPSENFSDKDENILKCKHNQREYVTTVLIIIYVFLQAFLPYSHFITKGYNNWTNGLYGYSWDMMVHTWFKDTTVLKVVDNANNLEYYVDPEVYAPNERWSRHGDMLHQYAKCLNQILLSESAKNAQPGISSNLSMYFEVWVGMNGRFTQRMFDSKVDLLKAKWSPFENVPFLMPLLDDAEHWRARLQTISEEVYSWYNHNDVLFYADFPGYELEKFITPETNNVSLTILEGEIAYTPEPTSMQPGISYRMTTGDSVNINPGYFHKVLNIGDTNAYYMFTFRNDTEIITKTGDIGKLKLPIFRELSSRLNDMIVFGSLICENFYKILVGCNDKCLRDEKIGRGAGRCLVIIAINRQREVTPRPLPESVARWWYASPPSEY
ncbi:hypothetical protein O0L34_g16196 [Tuta absoluta]|nr:hypothetical protein O0L34_g16196 [Tuta absoluta]